MIHVACMVDMRNAYISVGNPEGKRYCRREINMVIILK
jgi:hypothetical protein